MKLGLQGITIVFASGDSGVADRDGSCLVGLFPNPNLLLSSKGAGSLGIILKSRQNNKRWHDDSWNSVSAPSSLESFII
jgi:hypothetical protein